MNLAKAVELDPPGAGKYHYNLGALLMNSNQTDGALDEFKKPLTPIRTMRKRTTTTARRWLARRRSINAQAR